MNIDRAKIADFLAGIVQNTDRGLFIKSVDEDINWTTYLNQFSRDVWILILTSSVFHGMCFAFSQYGKKLAPHIPGTIWNVFTANFGADKIEISKSWQSLQVMKYFILISGLLLWISFRSQMTAVLSVEKLKLPFRNLEELANSDFT